MDENRSSQDAAPPTPDPGSSAPSSERLQEVIALVEAHIEQRYRIPVRFIDIPAPFVGDVDGEEIWVDYEQSPEIIAFNVIHLFGHTVQWNLLGQAPEIGNKAPGSYSEADLDEVVRCELVADDYRHPV